MDKEKLDLTLVLLQAVALLVQMASLIALIIYVRKTSQMASATNDMAQATKRSAETAEEMASASRKSAEAAEKTLEEIKESRDQEAAPYVVAYFDASPSSHLIYLVVRNIGKTVANNVKLRFDPPLLSGNNDIKIGEIPLVKEGIGSIPPGYEIRTLLDSAISYFGQKSLPLTYNVTISYFGGLRNERRILEQVLDLHALEGLILAHDKGLPDLVKQMENLVKHISDTSKETQKMAKNLENGVWLRNPELFFKTSERSDLSKSHLLAKLAEFKLLWISASKDRRDIFSSGLENKCMLIGQQLLIILSNFPEDSKEVRDAVIDIVTKLSKLGGIQFYLDGGRSDEKFINLGDSIVKRIEALIELINSENGSV